MTFARKQIDVTITLGSGQFGDNLGATKTMTNHRVIVDLHTPGGMESGTLFCQIYGMPMSEMNQLTQIGQFSNVVRTANMISIAAGNEGAAHTQIYQGVIISALGVYNHAPDSYLEVQAQSGIAAAVVPVGANSWNQPVSVDTIMTQLASQISPNPPVYVPNGVTTQLSYPYLSGTILTQIQQVCKAANCNYLLENGTLTTWPKGSSVAQPSVPVIKSPDMVGYPTITASGLEVQCLFNPNLRVGGTVQIETSLQIANNSNNKGIWKITDVKHRLESEKPAGAWFSYFVGSTVDGNF